MFRRYEIFLYPSLLFFKRILQDHEESNHILKSAVKGNQKAMENWMVISYNLKIKGTPFYGNQWYETVSPKIPFEIDRKTVDRIKNSMGFGFQHY